MLTLHEDDLTSDGTLALLAWHLSQMQANSPPEEVFALGAAALRAPDVRVWRAERDGRIAGLVALKRLDDRRAELKSMRTHPDHLRRGVARALLARAVATARADGCRWLSLETGDGPAFAAAQALYRDAGFVEGEAFGDYTAGPFHRFFHLPLAAPGLPSPSPSPTPLA